MEGMISIIFDVKMTKPKGTVRCQTQMEINVYSVDRDDGAYLLYGDWDGTREARRGSGLEFLEIIQHRLNFAMCDAYIAYSERCTLISLKACTV